MAYEQIRNVAQSNAQRNMKTYLDLRDYREILSDQDEKNLQDLFETKEYFELAKLDWNKVETKLVS